jgi:hypothetical protein
MRSRSGPAAALALVAALVLAPGGAGRGQDAWGVQFADVAAEAGFDAVTEAGGSDAKRYIVESTGGGVALLDYDDDGLLDVFVVNGRRLEEASGASRPVSHLYRNLGKNRFEDVTARAGITASGWGQAACAGDYDNDGRVDLFVTYFGDNLLFRNNGDGTFTEASRRAGLHSAGRRYSSGCAFLDYDRDGRLDLFVANYVDFDPSTAPLPGSSPTGCRWKGIPVFCGPRGLKGAQNALFHNDGGGRFTEVSRAAGILRAGRLSYALGAVAADLDNDGWPDIYVACDSTASLLYRNNRDGTFSEVGVEAGAAYNEDGREQAGMGVGIGDYDGDGALDLVVTNFSDDTPTLRRNHGDGTFTDVTARALPGWNTKLLGWGTGFADFDNDGLADLFFANGHVYPEIDRERLSTRYRQPKAVYRNLGNGAFADVSGRSGPGIALERSARGAAFGDLDNDGDVDVVVNNCHERPSLLENRGGNRGTWLALKLGGTRSNRSAIGARVRLTAGGRSQVGEVVSGGSWASQSDLRLHFGLGAARIVERIQVRWPSGIVQEVENVAVNQILRLAEPNP